MGNPALPVGTVTARDLQGSLEKAVSDVVCTMFNYQPMIVPCKDGAVTPGVSAIIGFGGRISGFVAVHLGTAVLAQVVIPYVARALVASTPWPCGRCRLTS